MLIDDIQILNLHDEDVVTHFVCKMIPNAQNTCNKLKTFAAPDRDKKLPNLSKRPSQSFDAHRISEAAFELGYITNSSPKEVIVEKVKKRLLETGINNISQSKFFVCPSQSLQARFLNMSIAYEKEMLAINHPNMEKNAKDAHLLMYLRADAEGRFCEIDPLTIVKDEGWVNFLSKIEEETIKNKQF